LPDLDKPPLSTLFGRFGYTFHIKARVPTPPRCQLVNFDAIFIELTTTSLYPKASYKLHLIASHQVWVLETAAMFSKGL
jgi:hypothetical protein